MIGFSSRFVYWKVDKVGLKDIMPVFLDGESQVVPSYIPTVLICRASRKGCRAEQLRRGSQFLV
jgi:hypothetical protein